MNLEVGICLPREVESVSLIRGVIIDTLTKLGVTPDCVSDIGLAVSEACSNVVHHAADADEYEVWLHVDDARSEIRIKNTGPGFDVAALSGVMPGTDSERGRGVAIMRTVMDDVSFSSEPEAGTVVHLVKNLDVLPSGALAKAAQRSGRGPSDPGGLGSGGGHRSPD